MPLIANVSQDTNLSTPLFSVGFTHGILDPSGYDSISSQVYQHSQSDRLRKMVIKTDTMDYTGNYDNLKRDDGKYIGVENPETNEMCLIPLKRVRVRPAVSIAQEGHEDDIVPESKPLTKQEQLESVIEAFGGAKQKKNMLLKRKHGINKEMIHDALDAAGVADLDLSATCVKDLDEEEKVLPSHNTTTTERSECYPMDEYLPESIRTDLEGFVDEIMEADTDTLAEWRKEGRYPPFIQKHLENLPLAEHQRKQKIVIIKYLLFLMKLFTFRASDLKSKDPFSTGDENLIYQMPASCFRYILDNFTVKSGRTRQLPPRKKDKTFIVILLLSLHLENYTLSTNQLLFTVKIGSKKLVQIAKNMGCKVRVNKKTEVPDVVIELVAPLKFPAPTTRPSFRARK